MRPRGVGRYWLMVLVLPLNHIVGTNWRLTLCKSEYLFHAQDIDLSFSEHHQSFLFYSVLLYCLNHLVLIPFLLLSQFPCFNTFAHNAWSWRLYCWLDLCR